MLNDRGKCTVGSGESKWIIREKKNKVTILIPAKLIAQIPLVQNRVLGSRRGRGKARELESWSSSELELKTGREVTKDKDNERQDYSLWSEGALWPQLS